MSDSGSVPEKNGLKSLLIKGLVSGVALAGTTAIPIVVQRSLQAPPVSPTMPVSPAQLSPLPDSSPVDSAAPSVSAVDEDEKKDADDEKGRKKRDDD